MNLNRVQIVDNDSHRMTRADYWNEGHQGVLWRHCEVLCPLTSRKAPAGEESDWLAR